MRWLPPLAWAGLLAVAAIGLWLWTDDLMEVILLPGAVLVSVLVAAGAARAREPAALTISDTSASAPLLAVGVTAVALGAAVGVWASLMGAGVLVLAAITAVLERRG